MVEKSDIVFVSVKPSIVPIALSDVKSVSDGKLFLSIAMGVTIEQLEKVSCNIKLIILKYCFAKSVAWFLLETVLGGSCDTCDAKYTGNYPERLFSVCSWLQGNG